MLPFGRLRCAGGVRGRCCWTVTGGGWEHG